MRTKGIEFTRHCDSCHNPIGVVSGALTQDAKVDRSFDEDGLTCTTCHSIQKLQSTLGNGGFVLGVPSVMVDEKGLASRALYRTRRSCSIPIATPKL